MQTEYEFVISKLQSGVFNFSVIAPMIGIDRHTLVLICNGKTQRPRQITINAIANFIRQVGE
jgi:hypothetical protein